MDHHPEICKKCACKCILVSEQCIYDHTSIEAKSGLLTKNRQVFDKVHDFVIAECIGEECLEQLCRAKKLAINQASEMNIKDWKSLIDPKWLLILNCDKFIKMYSSYIEYEILVISGGALTADGYVETDRRLENESGLQRQASSKNKSARLCNAKECAERYKRKFQKKWDKVKHLFDCVEDPKCVPCGQEKQKYIPMGFGKGGRSK